ncbi:RNA-binding protein 1-like [Primulina huaijiensis]|uniref:RNA-binding protein 1-like n=1 Tax=Primulina huaijiensis TaxID=1492673 RepID=UPI003CC706C3
MADAYWGYAGDMQQSAALASQLAKRPRSENEIPSGLGISSYCLREDEKGGQHVVRDTNSINASYDRYLRSAKISHGGESGRSVSVGLGGLRHLDDPRTSPLEGSNPVLVANDLSMGFGGRSKIPLPPDASGTLFVEGLPANCTRREVAHIFRPFVGYKEVRLVNKGSRHTGGDPLVFCFVDFQSPAHAATAMDSLKGYLFDEFDYDSGHLRLQFARHPGARSGGVYRGRR